MELIYRADGENKKGINLMSLPQTNIDANSCKTIIENLHRYLCSRGLPEDQRDDIIQETFESLYKSLSSQILIQNLNCYAIGIARNICRKRCRAKAKQAEVFEVIRLFVDLNKQTQTPEAICSARQELSLVNNQLLVSLEKEQAKRKRTKGVKHITPHDLKALALRETTLKKMATSTGASKTVIWDIARSVMKTLNNKMSLVAIMILCVVSFQTNLRVAKQTYQKPPSNIGNQSVKANIRLKSENIIQNNHKLALKPLPLDKTAVAIYQKDQESIGKSIEAHWSGK